MEMLFMVEENTPSEPRTSTRWDADAYARNTAHHRTHDDAFLRSIELRPDMQIVDVGCGVGDFTKLLAARVPTGSVVGVDPAEDLIAAASRRAPSNVAYFATPAQSLSTVVDQESVHGVVSRAALHWIPAPDHPKVLREMLRVLRPGGFLRLEFGGAGNIAETIAVLTDVAHRYGAPPSPWFFPDECEYSRLVELAGFEVRAGFVRLEPQRRSFDRATFIGWLGSQVLNAYETWIDPADHPRFRAEVAEMTDRFHAADTGWDRHYVRMQVLAHKPR